MAEVFTDVVPNGEEPTPTRGGPVPVGQRAQDRVAEYLRAHPDQEFTGHEVAAALDLNPNYISQVWKILRDKGAVVAGGSRGYYKAAPKRRRTRRAATPNVQNPIEVAERPRPDLPDKLTFRLIGELRDGRLLLEFTATGDAFVAERI